MTNGGVRFLNVGIAYEGTLDTQYIITLVSRILADKGYGMESPDVMQARTVITKFVPVYANRFSSNGVELAIFLTDGDGGSNTRQDIFDKINASKPELAPISAVGVAEPHLENWIIADENAVKTVFGLNSSRPLPHPTLKPKDRLISILSSSDYDGTPDDAKIIIASTANLQIISRKCSDFAAFLQSINDAINYIENQQHLDL